MMVVVKKKRHHHHHHRHHHDGSSKHKHKTKGYYQRLEKMFSSHQRMKIMVVLLVLMVGWRLVSYKSSRMIRVNVNENRMNGQGNKRMGGGDGDTVVVPLPKKRRRRLHLYEICPEIKKQVGNPYKHEYVETVGAAGSPLKAELTSWKKGNIPVILSVPHGASGKDPSFSWQSKHLPARAGASAVFNSSDFQSRLSRVSSDTNTPILANEIAALFKKKYKKQPFVVTANFHRKFVDVSRRVNGSKSCCEELWPKCTAVADYFVDLSTGKPDLSHAQKVNMARAVYDDYHHKLFESINEVHKMFPGKPIYFIDVHAQRAVSDEELGITADELMDTIIIGTQDGRLVRDRKSLYDSGGLLHSLLSKGVSIYPPSNDVSDHPKYNGGHIVAEYGNQNIIGAEINSLQMEFGFNLRMKTKPRQKVVKALVEALNQVISS